MTIQFVWLVYSSKCLLTDDLICMWYTEETNVYTYIYIYIYKLIKNPATDW